MKTQRELYVCEPYSTRAYIVDQDRNRVSVQDARALWEAHALGYYNLALEHLAKDADWDLQRLAELYQTRALKTFW